MAERSKTLDFQSELEIAQVRILSVTLAIFISTIDLWPMRTGNIRLKRGSVSPKKKPLWRNHVLTAIIFSFNSFNGSSRGYYIVTTLIRWGFQDSTQETHYKINNKQTLGEDHLQDTNCHQSWQVCSSLSTANFLLSAESQPPCCVSTSLTPTHELNESKTQNIDQVCTLLASGLTTPPSDASNDLRLVIIFLTVQNPIYEIS
ncbi:hypothetical protein J6590_011173 [Homalodisca vitripennis]|nr:hypothetical protein J6590_011173 [Homalodisca vitripennis]